MTPTVKDRPLAQRNRNAARQRLRATIDPASFPHEIDRQCCDCGEVKPCKWLGSFTATGKPEYRPRCHDCQNAYWRRWAKRNRTRRTSKALDRKFARKTRCIEYLGGMCSRCGYDGCVKAMSFHHRDPETKEVLISSILDYSWSRLVKELDLCVLLCSNCHMEEHCEQDHEVRASLGEPKQLGCTSHGGR